MKLSNNQVKYIRSLGQSKFRQKYENFVAEGDKSVVALLQSDFEIESLVGLPQWFEKNAHYIKSHNSKVCLASEEQMQQVSSLVNAPDILAVVHQKWVKVKDLLNTGKPLFFLDGVQDPGNVGTIIRVADWFGFGGVILGSGTADVYHPKVVQATMGSITAFGIARSEIKEILESGVLENIRVLDMEGQFLVQASLPKSGLFVLGSEGRGVSRDWLEAIPPQHRITIQGARNKMAESLNVGVAAGIVAQQVMIRG